MFSFLLLNNNYKNRMIPFNNNPNPAAPTIKPGVKPNVRPGRVSPIPRKEPSVKPRPKA